MTDPDTTGKGNIGKTHKAWVLILGGMILVAVVNVVIAFRMKPDDFDQNWRHGDAAPSQAVVLDAGVSPN